MNWPVGSRTGLGVASGILILSTTGCAGAFGTLLTDEERQEEHEALEGDQSRRYWEQLADEERQAIHLASGLLNCSEIQLRSTPGPFPVFVTGCKRQALCDYAPAGKKGPSRIACGETNRSMVAAAAGAREDPDVVDAIKTVSVLIECKRYKLKTSDGDFPITISGCGRSATCSRVPRPLVGSDVLFTLCEESHTTAMVRGEAKKTASSLFRCPIEKISVEGSSLFWAKGCRREALCQVVYTPMGFVMECRGMPANEPGQDFGDAFPLTAPPPTRVEFAEANSSVAAYRLRVSGAIYVCTNFSGRTACNVSSTAEP